MTDQQRISEIRGLLHSSEYSMTNLSMALEHAMEISRPDLHDVALQWILKAWERPETRGLVMPL